MQRQLTNRMGETAFNDWYQKMSGLMKQDGIEYIGAVNHIELSRQLSQAGFILYPTNFPETGCITVMKAMTQGAIPITSKFSESVLEKLTDSFDLGPELSLTPQMNYSEWLLQHWLPAVVTAARRDPTQLEDLRMRMKHFAAGRFSWSYSADIVEKLFYE